MRSMAHPNYKRQPWTEERKKAASERAKRAHKDQRKGIPRMELEEKEAAIAAALSQQMLDFVSKGEHTNPGTASALIAMARLCPTAFSALEFKDRFAMASTVIAHSKQSLSLYADMIESSRKDLREATKVLDELLSELGDYLEDEAQ